MNCNNCNSEILNGAEFCGNCGNKVMQNQGIQSTSNYLIAKKKSSKKTFVILGIIFLVIILIVTIFIFVNKSNKFEDPFENIDNLSIIDGIKAENISNVDKSFTKKIESDYNNGILSKDDYLLQLAYSIYDIDMIGSEYKDLELNFNNPRILFEKFNDMFSELSDDTIKYMFEKYTLSSVKLDVEEEPIISGTSNITNSKTKQLKNDDYNVSKLDNVKLSKNGNFLVYYTKEGKSSITDKTATDIAEFMENVVSGYKKKFNLNYKYEPRFNISSNLIDEITECPAGTAKGKACKLLEKNNININYLSTAMPIYVLDLGNDELGGFYVPSISVFMELVSKMISIVDDDVKFNSLSTAYSFPFFVVNSEQNNYDDMKITAAHELFHHYQKYICGNGSYEDCSSSEFTTETTANYASSIVNNKNKLENNILNKHAGVYINEVETSIDKVSIERLGYPSFTFAYNYANIIFDGDKHLFYSMKSTEPLKYLYNNSGGKYKDVLINTAKNNLTLGYDNKLLIGTQKGKVVYPKNYKNIEKTSYKQTIEIDYSSMNYYYINPLDYEKNSQLSFNGSSDNLTLLLFVNENSSYKYLYTHSLNKEFNINLDDFKNYKEIAIAIVNSEISGSLFYSYELNTDLEKISTVTPKSLNLETSKEEINDYSSFTCYKVESTGSDDFYRQINQIKLSFDEKDKISDMYFKATLKIKEQSYENVLVQKLVSSSLHLSTKVYKKKFKHVKIITNIGTDKYSVTLKYKKNYYEALYTLLESDSEMFEENKYNIINSLQKGGFTCKYEK